MKFSLKKTAISAFGVTAFSFAALIAPQPAMAGMGTSRPNPPPPPPPIDIVYKVGETSSQDSTIGLFKGYSGVTVNHVRSAADGTVSCVSGAGGVFRYTLITGQGADHWAMLFGILGHPSPAADITVRTDAKIDLALAPGQSDVNPRDADPSAVDWEMTYTIDRGAGESLPITTAPNFDYRTLSLGSVSLARNTTASPFAYRRVGGSDGDSLHPNNPAFDPANNAGIARSILRIKTLKSYVRNRIPRELALSWQDDPRNGAVYIEPGRHYTLYLNKMILETQK